MDVLPHSSAIPSKLYSDTANDHMLEQQHLAAPLSEADVIVDDDGHANDNGNEVQQLSYDLWPRYPGFGPMGFDVEQTTQLYLQLHQHCQLMIQVYALTACNKQYQEAAVITRNLIAEYQVRSPCCWQARLTTAAGQHVISHSAMRCDLRLCLHIQLASMVQDSPEVNSGPVCCCCHTS